MIKTYNVSQVDVIFLCCQISVVQALFNSHLDCTPHPRLSDPKNMAIIGSIYPLNFVSIPLRKMFRGVYFLGTSVIAPFPFLKTVVNTLRKIVKI